MTARELAGDEHECAALTQAAGEMALQSGRHEVALELLQSASAAHMAAGREQDAARLTRDIGLALIQATRMEEAADRITALVPELGDCAFPAHCRSRSAGNRITSRIASCPVRIIASRSMPRPSPPVGGMPYESAST